MQFIFPFSESKSENGVLNRSKILWSQTFASLLDLKLELLVKNTNRSNVSLQTLVFRKFTPQFFTLVNRGLFGMTTVQEEDRIIVITEGEFDAMAVH